MVDAGGELAIQLDEVGDQFQYVGEAREAGAGVVDGQARPDLADLVDRTRSRG